MVFVPEWMAFGDVGRGCRSLQGRCRPHSCTIRMQELPPRLYFCLRALRPMVSRRSVRQEKTLRHATMWHLFAIFKLHREMSKTSYSKQFQAIQCDNTGIEESCFELQRWQPATPFKEFPCMRCDIKHMSDNTLVTRNWFLVHARHWISLKWGHQIEITSKKFKAKMIEVKTHISK